jgi:hypothetical protein
MPIADQKPKPRHDRLQEMLMRKPNETRVNGQLLTPESQYKNANG